MSLWIGLLTSLELKRSFPASTCNNQVSCVEMWVDPGQEYSHVPEALYCTARSAFLASASHGEPWHLSTRGTCILPRLYSWSTSKDPKSNIFATDIFRSQRTWHALELGWTIWTMFTEVCQDSLPWPLLSGLWSSVHWVLKVVCSGETQAIENASLEAEMLRAKLDRTLAKVLLCHRDRLVLQCSAAPFIFCEAARSLAAMRNDGQSTAQQQVATGTTAEACGQSYCCNCIAIEGICK